MVYEKNNNLDAATLGKIVSARFLSLSLRAYERCVAKTESSPSFMALKSHVEASVLDHAILCKAATDQPSGSPLALGGIRPSAGRPSFVYHRMAFVREYRFDEDGIGRLKQVQGLSREMIATLHRLRLFNSRNRLTHALIQALLDVQADYLMSGDPLDLVSLSQARMTKILAERAHLSMVADAGRISRLVRGLSFKMTDEKIQPLTTLFPNERQLHCCCIDFLIKREQR